MCPHKSMLTSRTSVSTGSQMCEAIPCGNLTHRGRNTHITKSAVLLGTHSIDQITCWSVLLCRPWVALVLQRLRHYLPLTLKSLWGTIRDPRLKIIQMGSHIPFQTLECSSKLPESKWRVKLEKTPEASQPTPRALFNATQGWQVPRSVDSWTRQLSYSFVAAVRNWCWKGRKNIC